MLRAPMNKLSVLVSLALALVPVVASAKGLTIDDMNAMQRVSDPVVSPDGKSVVYSVRETDFAANRGRLDLWMTTIADGKTRRLTTSPENDSDPHWTKDGQWIYFISSRSGSPQVWRLSPSGGEAEQVTKLDVEINGFELFPDDKRLLIAMDVWPDAKTLADNKKMDAEKAKSKSSARIYDQLLFRHWDQFEDGKFSHLFVWTPADMGGKVDDARDLTPGQQSDSPTHPFGGMEEVGISPDGKQVAFCMRNSGRANAWETNTDVFLVPTDGRTKPVVLTADNKAYDFSPTFSPDGKSIAVGQMKRPGFEADRTRLSIIDVATKKTRVVTEAWDRSLGGVTWSADSKTIFTDSDNLGNKSLFSIDVASGTAKVIVEKGTNGGIQIAGDRIVYSHDGFAMPTELFTAKLDGSDQRQLTHFNDERVKKIEWGAAEQFSFKGAHGDTVYGFAMKPAGYKSGKAPIAFLIHGGPQGSFGDHFHYRWNPEVFAGAGFGVVFIDFHGSTGYGQAFTDAIRGDWGGAPYEDLMTGLDTAIAKYNWLDGNRAAALGASYGGFMINWIQGHTKRFKALVCHDGNLDEKAAYYDTEELWFPEWEHGGLPWEKPEGYDKDNPSNYIKNWATPTLVIHGGLDFRIPETAGMSTFTALQRMGIPSRFVLFPDENHWVLKPQNSKVWHDEVINWITKWTKPGAKPGPVPAKAK
ncbi:MAG TPA: S9 family peptidase [Kofleriaceae bacterium]